MVKIGLHDGLKFGGAVGSHGLKVVGSPDGPYVNKYVGSESRSYRWLNRWLITR